MWYWIWYPPDLLVTWGSTHACSIHDVQVVAYWVNWSIWASPSNLLHVLLSFLSHRMDMNGCFNPMANHHILLPKNHHKITPTNEPHGLALLPRGPTWDSHCWAASLWSTERISWANSLPAAIDQIRAGQKSKVRHGNCSDPVVSLISEVFATPPVKWLAGLLH